ncbi:MAG: hypothetical protein MZV70_12425 [Desulfobacterales bacterium]|nr:hypothetical protein [Desulfobacterales bacterium]
MANPEFIIRRHCPADHLRRFLPPPAGRGEPVFTEVMEGPVPLASLAPLSLARRRPRE